MPFKDPEQKLEYNRNYYRTHRKQVAKRHKKYRENHLKERKEYDKGYIQTHKESIKKRLNNFWKTHPEKIREYHSNRRKLGFNVIWKPKIETEKMVAHHINFNDVVYIPRRIHKSVWHNIKTGQGMREINNLSFKYMVSISLVFAIVPVNMGILP